MRSKINNRERLTTEDALNLGVIALYAPRNNACEITEEVVNLYLKISDNLDMKMEYTLYSVISILLDAFFDDEKEYRRLKLMLDKKTSSDSKGRFASHENTIESLKYAEEDLKFVSESLKEAENNLNEVNKELDVANKELVVANNNLTEVNKELDVANNDLAVANEKIARLEAENAKLTAQLNGK